MMSEVLTVQYLLTGTDSVNLDLIPPSALRTVSTVLYSKQVKKPDYSVIPEEIPKSIQSRWNHFYTHHLISQNHLITS